MTDALEPHGDPVIVSTSWRSNAQTYHTDPDCPAVDRIRHKRHIDRAAAEWKDLDQCQLCARGETDD